MPGVGKSGINFSSSPALKNLYDEVKLRGMSATRFIMAGMLLLITDGDVRTQAFNALRAFEERYGEADREEIRRFVEQRLWGGGGPDSPRPIRGRAGPRGETATRPRGRPGSI